MSGQMQKNENEIFDGSLGLYELNNDDLKNDSWR